MKYVGYWLIGLGVIYLLFAFNMDVSVSTPSTYIPGVGNIGGGDVANLDLMARRQNHLLVAALMTLVGVLLAVFAKESDGSITEAKGGSSISDDEKYDGERDIGTDSYRLWLSRKYSVSRNEVFDRFVIGETTFKTLDDALMYAHEKEDSKAAEAQAEAERREMRRASHDENVRINAERSEAEWQERKPKVFAACIVVLILSVGAYFLLRETPAEREARLAKAEASRVELIASAEEGFDVDLPEDVSQINIKDDAAGDSYLCDDSDKGHVLQFRSELNAEGVKDFLAKSLGDGTALYQGVEANFSWKWRKDGSQYILSMFESGPPTDVNFCKVTD